MASNKELTDEILSLKADAEVDGLNNKKLVSLLSSIKNAPESETQNAPESETQNAPESETQNAPESETQNVETFEVRKLVTNNLELDKSTVLFDYLPYEPNNLQLANEEFMKNIDKLVTLKKLEKI